MTVAEAKRILELYRSDDPSLNDRDMESALELARRDPELQAWFQEHLRTEQAIRLKFREVTVPAGLKERLRAQNKVLRPQFGWGAKQWLQLAACVAVLIGVAAALTYYTTRVHEPQFAEYESRMVRSALREYKMELLTKDMGQLRHWMETRNAPADFRVPKGLSKLTLTGGGVLRWHNHPVSMACFDRGDKQMLFLFVMDKNAVKDPPSNQPQLDKIKKLATASWTEGEKTYLLAGPGERDAIGKYL